MTADSQKMTLAQRLQQAWQAFRQTNWQAQAHYAVFRATQNLKNPNSWLQQYKQRFKADWQTWVGIGAGVTGLLMLLNPDGFWQWQFVIALASILLAPVLANSWHGMKRIFTEYPGKQFIGQVITVEQAVVDGIGSTRLDNQEWQLAGADCPAGTQARVIAVKDRTLYITPLNQPDVP